ncbi:MAG: arylsulfatase [Myxococcota bacterium]
MDGHWLMHVHVTEPHAAYDPPEEYLDGLDGLDPIPWDLTESEFHYDATGEWSGLTPDEQANLMAHLKVRYQAEIRYLDDQLGLAFADLEARGLLEDTLVVVYNDHGESFFEHGYQSHAHTLHAQENNGLLVFWSANLEPGVWSGPTHSTDLAATLLDLHGVTIPAEVDGVPLGTADADRARFQYSVARQGVLQSVIQGPHKLHYDWDDGRLELYDRVVDPDEAADLAATEAETVARLWALLRPEVEALDPLLVQAPVWPDLTTD